MHKLALTVTKSVQLVVNQFTRENCDSWEVSQQVSELKTSEGSETTLVSKGKIVLQLVMLMIL